MSANCCFAGLIAMIFEPFRHMLFQFRLVAVACLRTPVIEQPVECRPARNGPERFSTRWRAGTGLCPKAHCTTGTVVHKLCCGCLWPSAIWPQNGAVSERHDNIISAIWHRETRAIRRPTGSPPCLLAIEPKNISIGKIPCGEIEPMRFEVAGTPSARQRAGSALR
jgi:hypothetical protein